MADAQLNWKFIQLLNRLRYNAKHIRATISTIQKVSYALGSFCLKGSTYCVIICAGPSYLPAYTIFFLQNMFIDGVNLTKSDSVYSILKL